MLQADSLLNFSLKLSGIHGEGAEDDGECGCTTGKRWGLSGKSETKKRIVASEKAKAPVVKPGPPFQLYLQPMLFLLHQS